MPSPLNLPASSKVIVAKGYQKLNTSNAAAKADAKVGVKPDAKLPGDASSIDFSERDSVSQLGGSGDDRVQNRTEEPPFPGAEAKPELKQPRSSFMQEMVENMNSASGPSQPERLMVGPGGVIAFESPEPAEEQLSTQVTTEAKEARERAWSKWGGTIGMMANALMTPFMPIAGLVANSMAVTNSLLGKLMSERAGGDKSQLSLAALAKPQSSISA